MTTSIAPAPANDSAAVRTPSHERMSDALHQLQTLIDSQQELVERQRAEIEQLNAKVEQLRDYLEQFYKHLGFENRPMTAEEIKDMDENGVTSEEFLAEVEKVFGV